MTSSSSKCPKARSERASAVIRGVMERAAEPAVTLERPARGRHRHRAELGRRALSSAPPGARRRHRRPRQGREDQLLRFPAPAGGAAALPVHRRAALRRRRRSAPSLMRSIVMEFAAQLATLGLKRGLAQQLSTTDQPHACVVTDAHAGRLHRLGLLHRAADDLPAGDVPGRRDPRRRLAVADGDLRRSPAPTSRSPLSPIATTSARRCGPAPSSSPGRSASPPARSASYLAARRADHRLRDLGDGGAGRVAVAALSKLRPAAELEARTRRSCSAVARRNIPLAAADAIEWGSRRLDIAILGLFVAPYCGRRLLCRASRSPRFRRS